MDMGRPRRTGNRDLPDNLYPNRNGWKYVRPSDGKPVYLPAGTTREAAISTAVKCNAILTKPGSLVGAVLGRRMVKDAIKVFRDDDLPHRKWAPKTAEEYAIILRRLEADEGETLLDDYGVSDAAEYLRTKGIEARRKYRCMMLWVFACAVQEGWVGFNPIEQTRKVPPSERQRARLTKEAFAAIRAKAEPWLQRAMDFALVTLLRRSDVAGAKFADVREGRLHVVPKKTEDSTNVRLRITIGPELDATLAAMRDNIASPYIVHRLPLKARPRNMRADGRDHHTQVMPEQITRAFADARDAAALEFDGAPPSWHEIRSLGIARYRELGWTLEQVQALAGHATKAMTKVYAEGHEAPWTDVFAG